MSLLHDVAARGLRLLEPETAHGLTLRALQAGLGPKDGGLDDPALSVRLAGMDLPNCIGLAAGFDKDAQVFNPMLAAGFGFVECGTVTPRPQAGNPQPRLFRLAGDRAVINRLGFNNGGLDAFAERLGAPRQGVVGANLGAEQGLGRPDRRLCVGAAAAVGVVRTTSPSTSPPPTRRACATCRAAPRWRTWPAGCARRAGR